MASTGLLRSQDHTVVRIPHTWSVHEIKSFCSSRGLSLTATVNAVWAIVLWEYTAVDSISFPSLNTLEATNTWSQVGSLIDITSRISQILQQIQDTSKVLDQTPAAPAAQVSALLSSATIFKRGDVSLPVSTDSSFFTKLVCQVSATKFAVAVHYAPGSVQQSEADRLAAGFAHTLNLVLSSSDKALEEVDLTSDHDKAELLAWNKEQAPATVNNCAHVLFQGQVAARPEGMAVDAWDGSFTYADLDRASTIIAHHLTNMGVGPEVMVPLCFSKSRWAIAALMGVIKAGGAMVFIDPANPPSRRQDIIGQIGSDFVLTDSNHASSWEDMGIKPVVINQEMLDSQRERRSVPVSGVTPNNLLYVIFTSGTTGKPKGCLITHKAFLSGATQHSVKSNLGRNSRVMQLASYSFDVSVLEILTSLISGACVCTPDSAAMTQGLASIINGYQINWAFLTPSLVKLVKPEEVPTLKTLCLGGEPLHKIDLETWGGHLQLVNGYGPSECSVACSGDAHVKPDGHPQNIGKAVGGLVWIVQADNHDRLVPNGGIGELLISGPILSRGYLNNAEQTDQVFITDPLWCKEYGPGIPGGRRFYKTGDLARFMPDGTIFFIGRKDTQVKLRGLRIELGEIETNTAKHEYVKTVVVFLPKTGPCKEKLVAVLSLHDLSNDGEPGLVEPPMNVITTEQAKSMMDEVRAHVTKCVPEYMVPTVWITLEAWPLLASAKLNRKFVSKWLLEMTDDQYRDIAGIEAGDSDISGMTETENQLRDIFSRVLNLSLDFVTLDKSFLGLGGDSITAMQVMAQCRALGLSVGVKDILRSKNIPELALCVGAAGESAYDIEEQFDHPFQMSPVQLYYCSMLPEDFERQTENHFNQSFYLRLAKHISIDSLKAALDAVISRHSMLRARWSKDAEGWTQQVLSETEGSYRFKSHKLGAIRQAGPICATAQRSLSLNGPVFSADLMELADQQFLFMTAHHAIIDWVSWRIVLRDLESFLLSGSILEEQPIPFQNWINLQAEHAAEHGDPEKVLPFDVPQPNFGYWNMQGRPNTISETREEVLKLDKDLTNLLLGDQPHKALRTEILDFLLTTLLYSFGQVFSDRDLPALFREGHGREPWDSALDISGTVGWFTTMYPLAIEASSPADLVDMLKRAKDIRHAVPDNGRPYFASRHYNEKGMAAFAHHKQIEVSFDYLGQFQALDRDDALLRIEPRPSYIPQSDDVGKNLERFSLFEITAEVLQGQLQFGFVYNKGMRHQTKILNWIKTTGETLKSLANQMIRAPVDYTLSDFPLLSLTYDGLENLKERIDFTELEAVEDIYPCSPMQQGLLVSQALSGDGLYEYGHVMKVRSGKPGETIDADQFADAWAQVVQRHSSLRTIFLESAAQDGLFDQLVFKTVDANIVVTECAEDEVKDVFKAQEKITFRSRTPPHRMTVCRISEDELICHLEINHAIIDGGSIFNILKDLTEAYEGRLPSTPGFKFGDYIGFIESTSTEEALDFWKEYLDAQTPCYLPELANLSGQVTEKKDSVVEVDVTVSTADIKKFCESVNVTPVNLFQTAWGMVLRIFTESDDVCFGFLSSGRDAPLASINDGVGAFLTMLVCRLNLQENVKLTDAVSQVAEDFIKTLPHQFVGLANIQHALGMSGSPLFNTSISFSREDDDAGKKQRGIAIESMYNKDPTEYAVTLDIGLSQSRVKASMTHWTDYLSVEQVRSIAATFDKALHNIVHNGDLEIGKLELVNQHHLDKYVEFNGDEIPSSERTIFSDITYNARMAPDSEAICAWDGTWTYKELDEITNRLGHHLRGVGVGPETIVPHCFPKSAWAAITMVAIMKAGGAFASLDPAHPRNRLEGLIEEVQASVVCVCPETADRFEGMSQIKHLVVIDPEFVKGLPKRFGRPCPEVKPDNLACIVFSSGTTGKPKAISLQHNSMSTFADQVAPALKLDRNSRVFQFASFTFDVSNQDIFTTLQRGGCVCFPSDEERINDPAGAINRLRANWADMTSTVLSLMQPEQVPDLKLLCVGGEPLAREVMEAWAPAAEMHNVYGPAEACVTVTLSGALSTTSSSFDIGRAYGCWAWIVDPEDYNRLMPLGAVGELVVEGPMLARYYFNNPTQTEKAFVNNPTWAQSMTPGQERRFYRTGDICRMNTDGNISIIGRRDAQVKINGQRVQLEEINYQVQSQVGTKAQVLIEAIQLPSHSRGKTLVAFMTYEDTAAPAADGENLLLPVSDELAAEHAALQRSLSSRMPNYMIPPMYVPIVEVPLTKNGKLDRKRLQSMILDLSEEDIARYMLQHGMKKEMPQTASEKILQALWSKVLNLPSESIGTNDDFFRLGGDSIGAMKLVAAARTAHNIHITVPDIFQHPELSDMAKSIEFGGAAISVMSESEPFDLLSVDEETLESIKEEAAEQCGVEPHEIVDLYPCTALQEGLLALSNRLEGGAYIGQRVLRITNEAFGYEAFKDAWQTVAASEAILRTRIVDTKASGTLQAVLDRELEFIETDEDLDTYIKKDLATPIRYGGALMRLTFVNNWDGRYFIWSAHHAVYDGWSTGVLFERVSQALTIGVIDQSIPFKAFIGHLMQTDEAASDAFWEDQFSAKNGSESAVSYPEVTLGFKPNTDQAFHSRFSTKVVRPEGSNLTGAIILRAAWAITIAKYRQTSNIAFAVTLSGRSASVEGIAEMVGPSITTVPVRIDLDFEGETTVQQYLAAVQKQSNDMMPFEQTGLQNIRRRSEAARAAVDGLSSLFVVQASATNGDECFTGMENVPNKLEEFDTYPLVLQCNLADDGSVDVEARYDESVIPTSQMRRILRQYEFMLQQMCTKPATVLKQLNLVSPRDIVEIQQWNGPLPETIDTRIHDVVAQRVKEQPNAQAICAWDGDFTYKELAQITDKLASYLQQKLRVGPDVKVGLCFDKSKWYVVAMLAVLKAGGTYTGLNPTSPFAMLQGVVSDLEAPIVLCSSHHASMLRGVASSVIALDESLMKTIPTPPGPIRSRTLPSSPAFIVFTSGSTGKPKGIIVDHANFCSLDHYQEPILKIGKNTRLLQFASHSFDLPNLDYFGTLMRGGTVCVPSEEERMNDLGGAIRKYRANWTAMVATAATVLDPEDVPALETLCLCGEPVPVDLHARWSGRLKLINMYGPAECTVLTTTRQLLPETPPQNLGVGVGCRTWIVDENDYNRLVPIGCVGEICIEGPIVTRGYHNNAVLTARGYVEGPRFAEELGIPEMRMYLSGDLGIYNADGTLTCLGRKDTQIKIRGQRIEVSEVEHHINLNGFQVDEVAVERVYEGGEKDKPVLAAFIKVDCDESEASSLALPMVGERKNKLVELRQNLASTILGYMVPSLYIPISAMPMTGTGKKDRKTLRAAGEKFTAEQLEEYYIFDGEGDITQEDVSTNNEVLLQSLWAEILRVEPETIFANDHFFQKGGDSIRAIRLASACRRNNKLITVGDMFAHPRLSEMAKCLRNEGAADVEEVEAFAMISGQDTIAWAAERCEVDQADIEDIYPCSPLQSGLMSVSTRSPKAYVSVRVFDIPASMDLAKFKKAWIQAAQQLPIMRTKIIVDDDQKAMQVVVKEDMIFEEITGPMATFLDNHTLSNIHYGGPLTACAMSSKTRQFVWMAHHAVYDGFSASMLFGLVEMLYRGEPAPVAPGYNKFIHYIESIDDEESNDYWRQRLAGGAPVSFPIIQQADYKPRPDSEFLTSFNIKHDASSGFLKATILRAAWAIVTAKYTDSEDVVFGETLSGRNVPVVGIEEMAGPCITTMPNRVQLDANRAVGDFLNEIQEQAAAVIPFQHKGLQALRRLGADVKSSLDFQNLFVIQEAGERVQREEFLMEVHDSELLQGFFDSYAMVMECILEDNGDISVEARFDQNVLKTWQVDRLVTQFKHVINQLCSATEGLVLKNIDLLSAEDVKQIRAWNEEDDLSWVGSTVVDKFAEQVWFRSDELAVSAWDGEFTYQELDEVTNKLARALVCKGIKPETILPVCFEKSKWDVVAVLAIMKAGGVVAQMGASHPMSRKQEILEQTRAKFVLASREQAVDLKAVVDVLVIDEYSMKHIPAFKDVALPRVKPWMAAYVLFTSGSTGRSKGIVVEHRNLCTSSRAHGIDFKIDPGARVFQFASFTFDISCADIFTTLQRGATICIPSEEERVNDLAGAITKYNADWLFLTPTVAGLLNPDNTPTLRTLVLGGEAPTRENIETWSERVNLILVWGPAETTIYASSNPPATKETNPARLGRALGCHMWLTDAEDHNKLTPIGCVGEILVEGGIVSRGYLEEPEKTAAAYIEDPDWIKLDGGNDGRPRRFYKTGDLGRYDEDGVVCYISRKDNQVKLRGQRFELGEVETRIIAHGGVRHAVARIPRNGPLKDKLVVTMSFDAIPPAEAGTDLSHPRPLDESERAIVGGDMSAIRSDIENSLPSYMVPSLYISVESVPLNMNGKIDRKTVNIWLEGMDQDEYEELMKLGGSAEDEKLVASTKEEGIMQELVKSVLNVAEPDLGRSFLSLGGDSITAMQLRTKARGHGLAMSVQDILKSKSLSELAATVKAAKATRGAEYKEEVNVPFPLGPIQNLFFDTATTTTHFNQSFLLKVNRRVTASQMEKAIETVVSRHSMLRSRYEKSASGEWQQLISDNVKESYNFVSDKVENRKQVGKILGSRKDLDMDLANGPLLVTHLFDVASEGQWLFLSAHHLVVDLVSWRVMLGDLQEYLENGSVSSEVPLPFQAWLRLQKEYVATLDTKAVLPAKAPAARFDYWGMEQKPNTYGDVIEKEFELNEALTDKLFGSSNEAFNTEPNDVILAAVFHAFNSVFTDRALPAIHSEGHGREAWNEDINPDATVGWFTTMTPIYVGATSRDIIETVRLTKDLRRQIPSNGMPYFASRYLTEEGKEAFGTDPRIEIVFNYMGKYQQLESKDALFTEIPMTADENLVPSQMGKNLQRFGLIDVSAVVTHGKAKFNFGYSKHMRHQHKIGQWIAAIQKTLKQAADSLSSMEKQKTVSDFPLLTGLNDTKLSALSKNLASAGINMSEVEDIYPSAPIQQRMIAAQKRQPNQGLYEVDMFQDMIPVGSTKTVDVEKMRVAWQKVVDRHAILRTVFIPSPTRPGQHDQLVLSKYTVDLNVVQCAAADLASLMSEYKSLNYREMRPHQQLTLFITHENKMAVKLEISHALNDGMSTALMFRDLSLAYIDRLWSTPGPQFGDYISWLQKQNNAGDAEYWRDYIYSTGACNLPLSPVASFGRQQTAIDMELDPQVIAQLPAFCNKIGVTMATFFQAVWGLVLREYTGSDKTLFGYMTANRDVPLDGVNDMVGPLINVLLCRTEVSRGLRVDELLKKVQDDFLDSLPHQYGLEESIRKMGVKDSALFNSVMSLQYFKNNDNASDASSKSGGKQSSAMKDGFTFQQTGGKDPNEYDVSVGVQITNKSGKNDVQVNAQIGYWTDSLSEEDAHMIKSSFEKCALDLVQNEAKAF